MKTVIKLYAEMSSILVTPHRRQKASFGKCSSGWPRLGRTDRGGRYVKVNALKNCGRTYLNDCGNANQPSLDMLYMQATKAGG